MSGHDQTHRQEEHLHRFLGNRVQRISQDALERHAAFFYRSDDTAESWFGQHDAGRRLGNIGRGGHRDSHLRLAQRRRVIGAVAAHTDSVAALLERLDEVVLSLRKDAGEDSEILGADTARDGSGRTDFSIQADRVSDDRRRRRGIARHHHGANAQRAQLRNQRRRIRSRRIAEGDDSRELHAVRRTHSDGQNAETLRLQLVRCLWTASGAMAARCRRPRQTLPSRRALWRRPASVAVASDIFVAGSNGMNLISFGRSDGHFFRGGGPNGGIHRILPAVRTRQGSQPQNVRFVEAGHGMNGGYLQLVLRQRAGFIRAQDSMLAASSTAESRVGRTPRCARARAPSAAARVKVAGSATGIDARTAVSTRGTISLERHLERIGIPHQHHDDDAVEHGEIAHHAQNRLLLGAFDVRGANQFRRASELRARSGRRDLRDRFAAPHQRPRIGFKPGPASIGTDSPVSMDWSSRTDPCGQTHVGGNHGAER